MVFIDTGYLSDFYYLFNKKRKFIKIKSLTIQQIKEIYEANTVLFAKLNADIAERKLIDEINNLVDAKIKYDFQVIHYCTFSDFYSKIISENNEHIKKYDLSQITPDLLHEIIHKK